LRVYVPGAIVAVPPAAAKDFNPARSVMSAE